VHPKVVPAGTHPGEGQDRPSYGWSYDPHYDLLRGHNEVILEHSMTCHGLAAPNELLTTTYRWSYDPYMGSYDTHEWVGGGMVTL
jgi:hypothetical protein